MKNQFLPYEMAVKLKKLGFDNPVLGWYNSSKELVHDNPYSARTLIDAPLWQQAFEWFRVDHSIDSAIVVNRFGYYFTIIDVNNHIINSVSTLTYEEARLACLQKLIELATTI